VKLSFTVDDLTDHILVSTSMDANALLTSG
jgi:hypothetical protein